MNYVGNLLVFPDLKTRLKKEETELLAGRKMGSRPIAGLRVVKITSDRVHSHSELI